MTSVKDLNLSCSVANGNQSRGEVDTPPWGWGVDCLDITRINVSEIGEYSKKNLAETKL